MRSLILCAALTAASFASFTALTAAEDSPKTAPGPLEQIDAAFPEVPAALWADFMKAFEKQELWSFGQGMKIDAVKKEIAEFEQKYMVKGEINEANFLQLAEGTNVVSGGRKMHFRSHGIRIETTHIRFCTLEFRGDSPGDKGAFRVPDALLEPLNFKVALDIRFTHNFLITRFESFAAQSESLAAVFSRIMDSVNQGWRKDPSIAVAMSDAPLSERVTVSGFGLTAFEILEAAASAASFSILVNGGSGEGAFRNLCVVNTRDLLTKRGSRSYAEFVATLSTEGEGAGSAAKNPYPGLLKEALNKASEQIAAKKFKIVIAPSVK